MSDSELIALFIRTRDPDAFAELYNRYSERVFRFIFSLNRSREDAEDLTQVTFMKVRNKLSTFDPTRSFLPWVFTIAKHSLFDVKRSDRTSALRRAVREQDDSLFAGELPSSEPTPAEVLEAGELRVAVRECVDELPEPQRVAVYLFYFEEIPQTEIANIMDVPVGTVGSRVHHGLKKVGECLERKKAVSRV